MAPRPLSLSFPLCKVGTVPLILRDAQRHVLHRYKSALCHRVMSRCTLRPPPHWAAGAKTQRPLPLLTAVKETVPDATSCDSWRGQSHVYLPWAGLLSVLFVLM